MSLLSNPISKKGRGMEDCFPMGLQRIAFESRHRALFLDVSEIPCICAEASYVRICAGPETHLIRETMTSLEARLDPKVFLRNPPFCLC